MPTDPKVFSNHGDAQSPSVQVKTQKITKTAVAPYFFFLSFCPTVRANSYNMQVIQLTEERHMKVPCKWQTSLLSRTLAFIWNVKTVLLSRLSPLKILFPSFDWLLHKRKPSTSSVFSHRLRYKGGKGKIKHWEKWMQGDLKTKANTIKSSFFFKN